MTRKSQFKLKDIGRIITGKTPSSKNPEEFGNVCPFITPTDFQNYHKKVYNADRYISTFGITKHQGKILPENSIMVTCIGSDMGKVAINKVKCLTNQQLNSIIINNNIADYNYVYYFLRSIYEKLKLLSGDGTTMPIINKTDFGNIDIDLPPLNKQYLVSSILSSLDDKIELNLEMNKTMEEMAMAIYKEWFVDFGPFRDGEFVDSELGSIPKGWELTLLKDVCIKITKGTTPTTLKRKFTDSGINFLKVESLTNEGYFNKNKFAYIDEETNEILKRSKIINNDILYSIAGTVGRAGIATENILPANTNQALAIIRPDNQKINPYHLYYIIKSPKTNEQIFPNVVQAVQANLSLSMLSGLKFILPTIDIALDFSEKISSLRKMIDVNNSENEILSDIRDYLLPKLISGKIRVNAVEEKMKEVL